MKYSVIVPVYNGETTIRKLFERTRSFFEKEALPLEMIFVHDCGKDNSWEVLQKLKTEFPNLIKIIKLSRNFGQHNALICGFEYASGDYFITMDEDLQHAPEDIIKLISKQKEGDYDVVYGVYDKLKHSIFRNTTSRIMRKIIQIGIPDIYPKYTAYRLIKAEVAKLTLEMRNSYTFLDGYLSWVTSNFASCTVTHSERLSGESAYTIKKLLNHTINIFVTFSSLPIRLLRRLSYLVILATSCYSIYILIRKIVSDDFAVGFPSLILGIGFSLGIIMFALGIVGEYLFQINLKTTKRPNYVVNKFI